MVDEKAWRIRMVLAVSLVVVLWVASIFVMRCFEPELARRGLAGDMFGAVNSLFSGLAFAILILTIWLQREELQSQRGVQKATQEDLARSAQAQDALRIAAERLNEMNAWLRVQELWTDRTFTENRGRVFRRWRAGKRAMSRDDIQIEKDVCRRMDDFAHFAPDFVGLEKVLKIWDDPLAKAWLALEPRVVKERATTKWDKKWYAFESLGKEALAKLKAEGRYPMRRRT